MTQPNGVGHEALNPIHPSMEGKLDPHFVQLYNKHVANTPSGQIDLPLLRKNYSRIYSYGTAPAPETKNIKEISFPSFDGVLIKLRIYKPNEYDDDNNSDPLPVHIDFHGGGWGLGDLETESHVLKHYVSLAKIAVVDVEYRLVPDSPYPTGLKDCFAATEYIYKNAESLNFKKDSISVGGVSAGGNICLAVDHLARNAGIKLVLVTAGTPQIDDIESYATAADSPYPSNSDCEFAPTLNWARLKWFDKLKWDSLSKDSKIRAEQLEQIGWFRDIIHAPNFNNLSKTVIYTAGCDPMRDEGEAYAKKLLENGNEVVFKRFPGVPHPFMHMDADLWQAKEFIELTARELAIAHNTLALKGKEWK